MDLLRLHSRIPRGRMRPILLFESSAEGSDQLHPHVRIHCLRGHHCVLPLCHYQLGHARALSCFYDGSNSDRIDSLRRIHKDRFHVVRWHHGGPRRSPLCFLSAQLLLWADFPSGPMLRGGVHLWDLPHLRHSVHRGRQTQKASDCER